MTGEATQAALDRLDALIAAASVLAVAAPDEDGLYSSGFYTEFARWHTRALACIEDLTPGRGPFLSAFTKATSQAGDLVAGEGAGILTALRQDVADGYLRRTVALIAAEVFDDFLEMAQHLLDYGYTAPATSLAGAVLEDGLRRIGSNSGKVTVRPSDDLQSLNTKCADSGLYTQLERKRIGVWADIRNIADHGRFADLHETDARDLVQGVREFLTAYLV